MDENIEMLKKIILSMTAGSSPALDDIMPKNPFIFIYGLGKEGLTPFEYDLAEKYKGSEIDLSIRIMDMQEYFGHLHPAIPQIAQGIQTLYLHVEVMDVVQTDPKEVVKEMAQMAQCQGHCCGH
jgi:hypothetical protein